MKRYCLRVFSLVVAIFMLHSVHSASHYTSDSYDIRKLTDLPQSEIDDIFEDRNGFIWIASLGGFYRYDGYRYEAFSSCDNNNSAIKNMVISIAEDSGGNIWTSTYGKILCKINPETNTIRTYSLDKLLPKFYSLFDISALRIDDNDVIYGIGLQYIVKIELDRDNGYEISSCKLYPISAEERERRDLLSSVHIDRQNNVWIGSNQTLRRVVGERDDELIYETYNIQAQDIADYDDNAIVVAGNNLTILRENGSDERYSVESVTPLQCVATKVVAPDPHSIWVGDREGFYNYRKSGSSKWCLTYEFSEDNLPFDMSSCVVSALTCSANDILWVGTRGSGVGTITKKSNGFCNYPQDAKYIKHGEKISVRALFEDWQGNLWIGTERKGAIFQPAGSQYGESYHRIIVNDLDDRAYAFEQTSDDIVWVGTCYPNGLVAYNNKTLKKVEQKIGGLQLGFVFTLEMSDPYTLWAGTYNKGLWRLTIDDDGQVLDRQNFTSRNSSLNSNIIRSLYVNDVGDLWIATDVGINILKSTSLHDPMPHFNTSFNSHNSEMEQYYILQITQLSSGEMLFGTMGGGMGIYSSPDDTLRFITTEDGLANNSVKHILEDPSNASIVWLSTNRGVSKLDLESNEIVNYSSENGIVDCEFSEVCGVVRSSGTILFGNKSGFVSFDPTEITTSTFSPDLFFTDLYINHELITAGEEYNNRVILDKRLQYTSSLNLDYTERNFSIGFVGLNFMATHGDRYLYRLVGIDKDWVEARGENLFATYTNIDEGRYTFKVRCANSDGIWSSEELQLQVRISPPIYRSTFAYIVYILLLLGGLYLAYWIANLLISKQREVFVSQLEQRNAEEVIQHKLEFFMNISHEFRTPLTLINISLDELNKQNIGERSVAQIKYNVNRLMSLINQLLDFRKLERGKVQLKRVCTDMSEFLTTYYTSFRPLAQHNSIKYSYEASDERVLSNIDREMFEKVIVNILSNAFKYTDVGDSISLSIVKDSDRGVVSISVRDSGRGVPKEEISQLFERFYQGANRIYSANGNKGNGIGLALCRSIVELHGGEIWAESEINQGFECIVELPLSQKETSVVAMSSEEKISKESILLVEDMLYDIDRVNSISRNKGSRSTLLIVEDNEQLRMQLSQQLQDEYDVIMAEDGEQGLAMCREHKPTLVVTDIIMPKMNGVEMCRQIKSCEEISHTPIMVFSGDTTTKNQIDSFTIGGADGYLEKPFSIELFKSKVETILNNRELLKRRFYQESIISPESIARTPADQKFISKIISIVKDNINNSELSVEHIAGEYGVSRTYLNRKIKAITGETSTQFIRNIRLKYAAKLLLQKSMTVSEVAWAVGYNDVNTFRSRFKEMFGVLPTTYNGEAAVIRDRCKVAQ